MVSRSPIHTCTFSEFLTRGCLPQISEIMGWLWNQGSRKKGVHLATPIINGDGDKFEGRVEGNLGKLMRIQLPADIPASVPNYEMFKAEDELYGAFKSHVLALGLRETFRDLCARKRRQMSELRT